MYPKIIFVIGASGSGKTSNLKKLETENPNNFHYCYFDGFGVPSEADVVPKFGSWENWGKITTNRWLDAIQKNYKDERPAVFEGQIKPEYIEAACRERNIKEWTIILVTCSDEERKRRLIQRKQPELINERMLTWAKYLKDECLKRGSIILDNTNLSEAEGFKKLRDIIYKVGI